MPDVTERVRVDAPAELVYALVSDLPRMGEWSPECTGATWRHGATGPALGGQFTGHNRDGWKRWSTVGTIVRADPGHAFAFEVRVGPVRAALWTYVIESAGESCTVTEEWTDRRPPGIRTVMDRAFGARRELNRAGMAATLANLKAAAEAAAPTG